VPGAGLSGFVASGPAPPLAMVCHENNDQSATNERPPRKLPRGHRAQTILARRGKLPIRLSLVFTPEGGQSSRQAAHTPSASWSAHHLVGAVVTSGFLAKASRSR
jgi:hypothetical protein